MIWVDDSGGRPGIGRHGVDAGQGGVASVATARRGPDPPEDGAGGNPGGLLPGPQGANWTKLGRPVGCDGHAAAGALAFGVRQGQTQAAFAGLEVLNPDGGELGVAECAGEARQQQRAVTQSGQVGHDRDRDLAQDVRGGGEFLAGQLGRLGGGAVHADQPAMTCR